MSLAVASQEIDRVLRKLGRKPTPEEPRTIYDAARVAVIQRAPKRQAREAQAREHHAAVAQANRVPSRAGRDLPTETQLHDLAVLARRAGEAPPQAPTRGDAARELVRLRSASP